MSKSPWFRVALALGVLALPQLAGAASCMNKFVVRPEGGNRKVVTLLTGMLTFQEADALAKAITSNQAPALEWVDANGKMIAKQFGPLKAVRPMPVACDNRTSGSIVIVTFVTGDTPAKKMRVKLGPNSIVDFEQQAE
jgi:hypothetical protein